MTSPSSTRHSSISPSPSPTPSQHTSSSSTNQSSTTISILVVLPTPESIQQHTSVSSSSSCELNNNSSTGPSVPSAPIPSPLTSRQSASRVPTLKNTATTLLESHTNDPSAGSGRAVNGSSNSSGGGAGGGGITDVVNAGRRLSLAPGLGGGGPHRYRPTTSHQPSPRIEPNSDFFEPRSEGNTPFLGGNPNGSMTSHPPTPIVHESPDVVPVPAFGSRSGGPAAHGSNGISHGSGPGSSSRRRPMTAAAPTIVNRSSLVVPSAVLGGPGRMGGAGKTRQGWEGDQIVEVLRASSQEVTVVRNISQVSCILTPSSGGIPTYSTFSTQTLTAARSSSVTPVILVPLCDQPTLPSLSLLLQQGTTPSAVCFQQDLLERARQAEQTWLPTALNRVQAAIRIRDEVNRLNVDPNRKKPSNTDTPIILAYSANPALSHQTIAACVSAGCSGVLKPPYDFQTARMVRRMVRAAKEGRISSVVGLPNRTGDLSSPTGDDEDDPISRVILPPTALSMGGEHAGEIVLSGLIRHNSLRNSGATPHDSRNGSPLSNSRNANQQIPPRKNSLGRPSPLDPKNKRDSQSNIRSTLSTSNSSKSIATPTSTAAHSHSLSDNLARPHDGRRRSVDVSGLEFALRRAQKAFEQNKRPPSKARSRFSASKPLPTIFTPDDEGPLGEKMDMDEPESGIVSTLAVDPPETKETELAELLSSMYLQTQMAIRVQVGDDDYARLSEPLSPDRRRALVDAVASWNFKPHGLSDGDLYRVACLLFEVVVHSEALVGLDLKRDQINRFLFAIRAIYHAPNPYHNYIHAIDVLQATYIYLVQLELVPPFEHIRSWTPSTPAWKRPPIRSDLRPGSLRAREVIRPQDVLAIMIAAVGHDIGHPGLSNAFMKNAQTPLCVVYDDKSVLENMHCVLVVQLLRKHGFGFLLDPRHASEGTYPNPHRAALDARSFKRVLYSAILATDMSLHFTWVQGFQELRTTLEHRAWAGLEADPSRDEEERIILAQSFLKCADISNPTRPIDVSEYWSSALLREWAIQASLEVDLELPVSVIASADVALQAKGQIGFIDLFTQPLFDTVAELLPEFRRYAKWCSENRYVWEQRLDDARAQDPVLVQPLLYDASQNKRFATLFPMSLPTTLVSQMQSAIGSSDSATDLLSALSVRPPEAPIFSKNPQSELAARAMRAVYHSDLSSRPAAPGRVASFGRGTPGPGSVLEMETYLEGRRSSNPDILPSHLNEGVRTS
ncbi:hypothetical protein BD324DRAFT_614437 [Kockovaella imperatae]|uniref:Phosphodiesterase n=1 Tax=Kockovaella imperatae TaxID=4999 RepID=A0A1Y1UNK5_9TREE|nr:hypothetical protein BD324DRAFT_614437 [Kockovaella imperatae]ORX39638.1 hypothetical protein BD324DRAFT_614437 [Kockovaella imperatae]